MEITRSEGRRREIERVAYEVLAERGYRATSMLEIAKRAKASNETLYRWYGNKQNLFAALVRRNAEEVVSKLKKNTEEPGDPVATLRMIGPLLLELVTGEKAVALNRAAASDAIETGILGKTIASSGRAEVVPLLARVFAEAQNRKVLASANPGDVAAVYVGLLIGDLQIRRVIGARQALTRKEIADRAAQALELTFRLFGHRKLRERRPK